MFLVLKVVGIFLTLNFFPMQDPETLTLGEKIELQKEFSIDYDLGNSLIYLSNICLTVLIVYLIYSFYIFWRLTHSNDGNFNK